LRDALGRRGLMRVHPGVGHPVIHLDDRWREPGGGLSPSRRSALRRSRRRAQSLGDVSVQLLAPTPDELEPLLVEAIEVERRSWKGAAGTALAHDGPRNRFVRRYAREMAARGRLRMQFLRIGGAAAAMHIAVEWSDRLWLVKIGYDPDYSSVSPGQILLAHSIADGAQRGLRDYHLLGFTEEWTQAWTSDEEPCVTIDAYPATRRGFVALTDDGLRIAQRRIAPGHPDGRMD
jgi:CelD/BcsL family acetyltransferase involved in cellulose biosynthesis